MTQPNEPIEPEIVEEQDAEPAPSTIATQQEAPAWLSREDQQLVRETIAQDLPEPEFRVFMAAARAVRLNPLQRQIYGIMRKGRLSIQTGIDGFRLIARRDGLAGIDDAVFRYAPDDAAEARPLAATVTVYRWGPGGQREAYSATARMSEYNAGGRMWQRMPHQMLAKCAEACALRKGFQECSGLYTSDEMEQADSPPPTVHQEPHRPTPPPVDPAMVEQAWGRLERAWYAYVKAKGETPEALEARKTAFWARAAGLRRWPPNASIATLDAAAEGLAARTKELRDESSETPPSEPPEEHPPGFEPEPEPRPNTPADVGFNGGDDGNRSGPQSIGDSLETLKRELGAVVKQKATAPDGLYRSEDLEVAADDLEGMEGVEWQSK